MSHERWRREQTYKAAERIELAQSGDKKLPHPSQDEQRGAEERIQEYVSPRIEAIGPSREAAIPALGGH